MNKTLLFGATGLVGSALLDLLLEEENAAEVLAFSRRPVSQISPVLRQIDFDYRDWESIREHFTAGARIFCCIGTTRAKTPDKKEYRDIDYGIPVKLAEYALAGGCHGLYIVSSIGADENSSFFYSRLKGEMERDVLKKNVPETYFFRPSLLKGARQEKRRGEDLGKCLNAVFSFLFPRLLKKYLGVEASAVARAMLRIAKEGYPVRAIENHVIIELGES
jgi:uncharacterized protein YbjT (DUF2867 family)